MKYIHSRVTAAQHTAHITLAIAWHITLAIAWQTDSFGSMASDGKCLAVASVVVVAAAAAAAAEPVAGVQQVWAEEVFVD